jgi:uncharacterized protein (TIGR02722 family)
MKSHGAGRRAGRILLAGIVLLGAAQAALTGCAQRKVVSRVDTNETIDLSGRWNDTDARLVADEMIADCMGRPWTTEFAAAKGRKPTVITGSIRNKTMEHIAVGTFLGDIERAMVNSGRAQVVASAEERDEIRAERADQRANASPETIKRMGQEAGADYMLIGEINQINDREGNEEVRFYQVDLTLVDIETNVKSWIGQKKIKKYVSTSKYKP